MAKIGWILAKYHLCKKYENYYVCMDIRVISAYRASAPIKKSQLFRCPLPRVPLPSLAPLEGLRSPSQLHRPPPLLRLLSSASSSSSLAPTCSAGEERGLRRRRRCPPLRPLPPLRKEVCGGGGGAHH